MGDARGKDCAQSVHPGSRRRRRGQSMFPFPAALPAVPKRLILDARNRLWSPGRIRRWCCRGGITHGRRSSTAPLEKHGLMEDHMTDLMHDVSDVTPRRGFFTRVAGVMALGLAGFAATPLRAQTAAPSSGPDWPGTLKGRYRQVVDAYEVN